MNKVREDVAGYITCPICGSKTFVIKGTRGKVSTFCKCGHILHFDYDKMIAMPSKPGRGLSERFAKEKRKS